MKKFTKVIAIVLVLATLVCVFASCGKKISGKYTGEINVVVASYKVTYNFSGSKVTAEAYVAGVKVTDGSFEGKYAIKDGEITFTYEINGEEKNLTQSFEELDDGSIKIGIITYKKG